MDGLQILGYAKPYLTQEQIVDEDESIVDDVGVLEAFDAY